MEKGKEVNRAPLSPTASRKHRNEEKKKKKKEAEERRRRIFSPNNGRIRRILKPETGGDLNDLKSARHNGTPKPLRGEHKRPRGRGRIKPKEGKRGQRRRRRWNRRRRNDSCSAPGKQESFSTEEWVEKEKAGGRFEKKDLLNLSGVHAPS